MGDYLWDKEGEDAEVAQLEQLLQPLAYRGNPPRVPSRRGSRVWLPFGALAAAALVAIFVLRPSPKPRGEDPLAWIEAGASRKQITIGDLGTLILEPDTRARMVATGTAQRRVELDHGTVRAQITAPARAFAIQTKYVTAIDLGCAFSLSVDVSGRGKLIVTEGAVALADHSSREVVVPAGSECGLSEQGPGEPRLSDAKPAVPAADNPHAKPHAKSHIEKSNFHKAHVEKSHPQPADTRPAASKSSSTAPKASSPATRDPRKKLGHDALQDMDHSAQ